MTKICNIEYLETAIKDLEEIIIYASENGKTYVNELIDELDDKISILKQFPNMGKVYNNIQLINKYHVILINQYLIFYMINNKSIVIHRIIHNKRNYMSFI